MANDASTGCHFQLFITSLLPATAAHHCEEIRDRVHDDQWAVDRN
jgi:hypothetical protein